MIKSVATRALLFFGLLATLIAASPVALAQSGCSYIANGAVLTAAQWNQCFAAKQNVLGYVPVNKAGDVMLGKLVVLQSTVTGAGLNLPQGAAPTNPNNGDVWTTISGIFVRINGLTVGPLASSGSLPLPNGDIFVGNVSNVSTAVTPSGDLSMTNAGVFTVSSYNGGTVFGTAAAANVGTSGNTVPKNNAANVFSAAQTVSLNAAALPTPISGAPMIVGAADGAVGRIQVDSFGAISAFTGAIYGGTAASPTQVLSGTQLTGINAYAYTGSALVGPLVSFRTYAAENIAVGAWGTKACIATTPSTTTTLTDGLCQQNSGGVTVGSPTGGDKGAGTINAAGLYVNGTAVGAAAVTSLTGDVTGTGPGATATTIAANVVTYAKFQQVAASSLVGNATGSLANATGVTLGATLAFSGAALQTAAHTGDVTTLANSFVTTLANIPSGVPMAGSLLATAIAAPSSPAAGKVSIYTDSTDLRLHDKNASGVIGTTVVADTGASNNFLTAISAAGVISKAQPAFSNLSGSATCAQLPALTGDVTTSAGACATTLATAQPAVHTWALAQTFTVAPVFTDQSGSRSALGLGTMATQAASAVAITGGTFAGITSAAFRDASAAFDVTMAFNSVSATISAARTLTFDVGNVAHTVKWGTTANTITFPNLPSFTVITNGDTGTVTNAMLANSAVTVNGTSISLGASGTVTAAAGTLTGTTLNATVVTSSLTSVGTIATGVWQGTAVAAGFGGTGQTTYTKGDLLVTPGSTTINKLAVGTDGFLLTADAASTNGLKWAAPAALTTGTTLALTNTSATGLVVGANGATNPVFQVDSSTASQAAGMKLTGAATGGTVALAAIDSGSNTNITINGKGTGTIGIGSVSTGAVTITPGLTLSAALTYGGVALSNSVSGTGSMALTASPTFTGTVNGANLVLTGYLNTGASGGAIANENFLGPRSATSNPILDIGAPTGQTGAYLVGSTQSTGLVFQIDLSGTFGIAHSGTANSFLSSPSAAVWQLGAADAASPVAQTLKFQDVVAGTNNVAGANATIQASAGTGTGAGGSIIFQVAAAGSTGTAKNAQATALTIDSTKLATFAGQINVAAMTQTSAAQSGTVCYNSGTGAITYDATVGCLASTMRVKTNWRDIEPTVALAEVISMRPGSFNYVGGLGLPEGEQVGLAAEQMAKVDDRLVAYDNEGRLRGVRYQQASALYAAAIRALKADNDNLLDRVRKLEGARR